MSETEIIPKEKKKFKPVLMLFIFFITLIVLLLFFAFFTESGLSGITGLATGSFNEGNAIRISAELSPPEYFEINDQVDKLEFKTSTKGSLTVGKQIIDLADIKKATISIVGFDGKISLVSNELMIDGDAYKVLVNDVPISSKSGSDIKVNLENPITYDYFKIENLYIKSLSLKTSGRIMLNDEKVTINIKDDDVQIEKFKGNLEITRTRFRLDGLADQSKVLGLLDIKSSSSKSSENLENNSSEENNTQ